jgi:glycosyltransferase involved in cell wall biosynthesis
VSGAVRARPNPFAPVIAPVPEGAPRPFWSVMIPTFDCADYLRRTLAGVLAEDPGPAEMQIEVVDDHSTRDDPAAVVRTLGGDRVAFHRQPRNVGAIANFNTCLVRARGRWVHVLHGDDLVVPGFYAAMREAAERRPDLGAAFCRCSVVDEEDRELELYDLEREGSGPLDGFIERLGVWARIQTPTIVVRRAVYEDLGGFDPRLVHAADWEMWQRVAVHYPLWYEARSLARYRKHSASDTSRLVRTGANIADIRRAIEVVQGYLPAASAPRLRRAALLHYAESAWWTAKQLRARGDAAGAVAQLRQAARCFRDAGRLGLAFRLWGSAVKLRTRHWTTAHA